MTAKSLLTALLPLVSDLSRELPEGERYRRLLEAMRALLPCDAAALLRLDGEWLVPLAVDGLSTDTLGASRSANTHASRPCSAAPVPPGSPLTATCLTPMTAWSMVSMITWKSTIAWAARCSSTSGRGAC